MAPTTLDGWLAWLERLHPREIELGLGRIGRVARRLDLPAEQAPLITVAGTNGKGSTVACLESMLRAGGYRPGAFTSPHLLAYNERIRIDGEPVDDEAILDAFRAIDRERGEITLTYFEFATLAAVWCFREAGASPWILEVGLGGRLDATNCLDADVAVVTAIDLDHMEWLGNTREAIATEKLGIARPGRPIICADPDPPSPVGETARALSSPLHQLGRHYHYRATVTDWSWWNDQRVFDHLPRPHWMGEDALANAAGAIAAITDGLPALDLDAESIARGLANAHITGRQTWVPGRGAGWLLDVGHNPAAIDLLARRLEGFRQHGRVRLAFGLMARKPLGALIARLAPVVDEWFALSLDDPQSFSADAIERALDDAGQAVIGQGDARLARSILEARAEADDLSVAAGSFRVVEAFMRAGVVPCNHRVSGRD
ncbi:bifunctional folylpolyglutamate synthase/dihydrofolate synthase [Spiribacter vilamensis]|uniref:Dihydrofolate synthase/folylpolyglutamate synthase n=1 Tax=Spiribacter vilamensis TaxID=531306 RepID=A0A4Q8CYD1_9GAMM|nr:folylpolyglutamate synthase/dihydrofolate synthase family protein [Spiribacter vilamensis]RZU97989.1 dihydrofolate synthase/folylpolyglutamate synthase [Spiribacter vilamensis]TVO61099.1 bifunctional folylpolyglutamate synthase/dihydrofolate synthase [Spiribacter vilamensis]